jgi:hypothetical protein
MDNEQEVARRRFLTVLVSKTKAVIADCETIRGIQGKLKQVLEKLFSSGFMTHGCFELFYDSCQACTLLMGVTFPLDTSVQSLGNANLSINGFYSVNCRKPGDQVYGAAKKPPDSVTP